MKTNQTFIIFAICLNFATVGVAAAAAKEPTTLMCLPGELIFSETFDPGEEKTKSMSLNLNLSSSITSISLSLPYVILVPLDFDEAIA